MTDYAKRRGALLQELDGLKVEVDAAKRIGRLILDRPPLNIVSYRARSQIAALFEEFDLDDAVGVVVVRGAGGIYTSGGDIRGFLDVPADGMSDLAYNIAAPARCRKPVICAMEKFAFGVGLELALACDFRFATKDTQVALPEITLGEMPGSGGSARLVKLIGLTRAKDMVLLGKRIPAQQAVDWGILTAVAADSEALTELVVDTAAQLNAKAPIALKALKRALNTMDEAGTGVGLDIEGHSYEKLRRTEDYREGIMAFVEKRKPKFTGR